MSENVSARFSIDERDFVDDKYKAMYGYIRIWNAYYQNTPAGLTTFAVNSEVYKNSTVTYPALYRVSNKVASLIFSELPKFDFDAKSQSRMDYIIQKNELFNKLRLAQAEAAGLGNVFLKLNVAKDKDYPIIEVVRAVDAAPVYVDWGIITEATFYTLEKKKDNICWWLAQTYTEQAGKKVIVNTLYKGTMDSLGKEVVLTDIEETKKINPIDDLKTDSQWFVHVKSPMPNNKDPLSPLGISIAANCLEQIDHINLTMQSYYKDDKVKQPKVVVTEDLVSNRTINGKIEHKVDYDEEFYIKLNPSADGSQLYKALDMKSKQGDFEESLQGKLDRFYESCGLFRSSIQKNSGAKTATEWELADKDSVDTGGDYKNVWITALQNLFGAVMEIDNVYFQDMGVTERTRHDLKQDITIQFMDSIKNDQQEQAEQADKLYKDDMISLFTALQKIFPLWSDDQINEEIARKNAEKAASAKVTEVDFFNNGGG